MTIKEKLEKIKAAIAAIRQVERGNGAAIPANAGPGAVVEHMFDFNAPRVRTLWDDINTIDSVKGVVYGVYAGLRAAEPLDLTAEELMEYAVNDERLTAGQHSWAVVRITKTGTEIVTHGGNFYQKYEQVETTDEATGAITTTVEQQDITDDLRSRMLKLDAAWLGVEHWSCVPGRHPVYTEDGRQYYCVPCELPASLQQLLVMHIYTAGEQVDYSLNKSAYTDDGEMIKLPEGIWYVYNNTNLASAPEGLLVPVELGADRIMIDYSPVADPLSRLALKGDSFGEEYVISVIDGNTQMEGTWNE